ncbi:hypothetical protein L596_009692 [Steinernema carpocapsae]|uniref:Transforming acidic coiled-coil-containing protein C-terminal domain-containing protein n=1 Tax=Steinernema carpocapsae TaxID=34508 RepID=A0A4U5PGA7_STECR|nr:hypothetical protein L596_009692 [Steinernema carpocapsae]
MSEGFSDLEDNVSEPEGDFTLQRPDTSRKPVEAESLAESSDVSFSDRGSERSTLSRHYSQSRACSCAWDLFPHDVQNAIDEDSENNPALKGLADLLKRYHIDELRNRGDSFRIAEPRRSPPKSTFSVVSERPPISICERAENAENEPTKAITSEAERVVQNILQETKQNITQVQQAQNVELDELKENLAKLHIEREQQNLKYEQLLKALDVLRVEKEIYQDEIQKMVDDADEIEGRFEKERNELIREIQDAQNALRMKEKDVQELKDALINDGARIEKYRGIIRKNFEHNEKFNKENERLRATNASRQDVINQVREEVKKILSQRKRLEKFEGAKKLLESLEKMEKVAATVRSRDSTFRS